MSEKLKLNLKILRQRFYDNEKTFGIYLCEPSDKTDNDNSCITLSEEGTCVITGITPKLQLGSKYNIEAEETNHPKYGLQYKILYPVIDKPTTKTEEQSFLKNLVTAKQYSEIIKIYDYPIKAIMEDTFDYSKVKGIGAKYLEIIKNRVKDNMHMLTISAEIGKYGLDFDAIKKIVAHFKNASIALQKIRDNPYILYSEVKGFGFSRTDIIAQQMGIVSDDPRRIEAAILYALEQEEKGGNTYGYIEDIRDKTEELIGIRIDNINDYLSSDNFYTDGIRLARKFIYDIEREIGYKLIHRLLNSHTVFTDNEIKYSIRNSESETGIEYDIKQKQLFYELNKNDVVVLTGFPGTGKSSTMRGVLDMLDSKDLEYVLMSPTARAAKVLAKSTGREAGTIHRTLGIGINKTTSDDYFDESRPMEADVVVIDEISMVDIFVFIKILQALPEQCKLLLVGDYEQLESISAGNILYDLINSKTIPCVQLDKVFRQKGESGLLSAITSIRHGEIFFDKDLESQELGRNKDCKIWFGSKDVTAQRIKMIYQSCLKKFNKEDIMVISPMKKGSAGVRELNNILQIVANPPSEDKKELNARNSIFRVGDMVMHIVNDYNAEILDDDYNKIGIGVFNGDIGFIKRINLGSDLEVYVEYPFGIIRYDAENLDELELAYCATTNKHQGGQAKVVIYALDMTHYPMLKRSQPYTAISRATDLVFIIGDPRALQIAIDNNQITQKRTFLLENLKQFIKI